MLKTPVCTVEKKWIHAFLKAISLKGNANAPIQNFILLH